MAVISRGGFKEELVYSLVYDTLTQKGIDVSNCETVGQGNGIMQDTQLLALS